MLLPSTANTFLSNIKQPVIIQDWVSFRLGLQAIWLVLNTPIKF
jgi:hypothetical protein